MRAAILVSLVLGAIVLPAAAQTPPAPPPNCSDPAHRQFDFWIGTWRVDRPDGTFAGINTIRPRFSGCVVEEQWEGAGMTGGSFNVYDRRSGRWHQTWVDSTGGLLQLEGGLKDGAMVLSGKTGTTEQRITWRRLEGGRLRQTWEQSSDGQTWRTVFDGFYSPLLQQ